MLAQKRTRENAEFYMEIEKQHKSDGKIGKTAEVRPNQDCADREEFASEFIPKCVAHATV